MRLPKLMIAPNGARKTTKDHPAIPVTIEQTIVSAKKCFAAGADGIHAHIRDKDQKHILDAGIYKELLRELKIQVPEMYPQITTESCGVYSAQQQRQLVKDVEPSAVSIGLKEIFSDGEIDKNRKFFQFAEDAGIHIQFILYDPTEIDFLAEMLEKNIISEFNKAVLFVLGRYTENQQSDPQEIEKFRNAMHHVKLDLDWGVCAFGIKETTCLVKANLLGGKMRVGFENNFENMDGSIASSNQERVKHLLKAIAEKR